jgi:hypothetical protein
VQRKIEKKPMIHIENSDGDQVFPGERQTRAEVSRRHSMQAKKSKSNPDAKLFEEHRRMPELPDVRGARGKSPEEKQQEVLLLLQHFHCFITDHYGPRCSDFKGGCRICAMWAVYDLVDAMICE